MNLKSTIALHGAAGGDSWLVHPPGLETDTPKVRDMARRRLVKTNPDVDAAKETKKKLNYKEKPQSDNSGFIGKQFRTQDTKYGHLIDEFDSSKEATKASLARPYTRVLRHAEPQFTNKGRNAARKKVAKVNPDVF